MTYSRVSPPDRIGVKEAVRAAADRCTFPVRLESTGFDDKTGGFLIILSDARSALGAGPFTAFRVSAATGMVLAQQPWHPAICSSGKPQ